MNTPENLKYTKSHEWVEFTENGARVGLSDFAQDQLGDIVFVNLPEVGDTLAVGDTLGDVESVKAVSDVFAPVGGEVVAVNEELLDAPELINSDPYGAWLVELGSLDGQEELLDAAAYIALCAQEG